MTKEQILKIRKHAMAYSIGPAQFKKIVSSPKQKITRKNAEKLLANFKKQFPAMFGTPPATN